MIRTRTRKQLNASLVLLWLAISAGLSARTEAHVGGRVFPIPELTDEMLAGIQLDGYVYEEWFDQIGEPALTSVDFRDETRNSIHDPADLDFRIWLAWHDEPARFYVAFVAADDSYWNTFTYTESSGPDNMMSGWRGGNDGIALGVDGDHSGGPGFSGWVGRDRIAESSGNAQAYHAISHTPDGPLLDDPKSRHVGGVSSWMTLSPYAEAAGNVVGEAPVFWSIELYVTPFDRRDDLTSPEGSVVSDLSAGQIIGFTIGVYENDEGDPHEQIAQLAPEVHVTGSDKEIFDDVEDYVADNFLDGLLLPANAAGPVENSAVESFSWGRIKASLAVE